jgi:hypothetical protein
MVLMSVHRGVMKTSAGMWRYTIERLLEDKKAGVTDKERAELVADLENIVTNGSNTADSAKSTISSGSIRRLVSRSSILRAWPTPCSRRRCCRRRPTNIEMLG